MAIETIHMINNVLFAQRFPVAVWNEQKKCFLLVTLGVYRPWVIVLHVCTIFTTCQTILLMAQQSQVDWRVNKRGVMCACVCVRGAFITIGSHVIRIPLIAREWEKKSDSVLVCTEKNYRRDWREKEDCRKNFRIHFWWLFLYLSRSR